jgi:hypothetical protein
VLVWHRCERFYNWSGRAADLLLLLDDTAATLRRRKPAEGPRQ